LQAIESELGVAQTPVEVAVDDWALSTVGELGDRTRIRGAAGVIPPGSGRRRRRARTGPADYAPVGTSARATSSWATNWSSRSAHQGRGMQLLAWARIVSAAFVIALGVFATFVLIRTNMDQIPRVTNITAHSGTDSVEFSW